MRRRWYALVAAGAVLVGAALVGFVVAPTAQATSDQTFTKTVNRVFYNADGSTTPADPDHPDGYDVKLTVSSTQNLRGNQPITVSWSGAHPTGGIVQNPAYGAQGSQMEYPFILMECRGTATTLSPQTCWTQTSSAERIQRSGAASYPAWRSDGKATDADRAQQVGVPSQLPSSCAPTATENIRWVPTTAVDGTHYYGGCLSDAPEQSEEPASGVPDNTTYGITGTDGTGSAQFAVWTSDENATLGCSASVACSLVAVPITGIDCDPNFTTTSDGTGAALAIKPTSYAQYQTKCEGADQWAPGQVSDNSAKFNLATSGRLWWSASNWDNRIVVPLSFAVSGSICSVVSTTAPLLAYGSVLMTDIAAQWQPTFCATKGYQPFLHVQATDTQARTLVDAGSIQVGLSSGPPDGGFGSGTVAQAPVAVTGFAIGYTIDGADGQPYTRLKLDARLLAKLLSESYTGGGGSDDPGITGNPSTILADPEFHALNPDLPTGLQQVVNSAASMISLSNDSDMLSALSSYIAADPDARKWLEGVPDPWGMRVNPAYQLDLPDHQDSGATHFSLPVSSWPLLDPWSIPADPDELCLAGVPFLAQVAHPLSQVSQIEQDLEFGISNSQTTCPDKTDANPTVAKTEGLQAPGHRFVIGIVPLTAVSRYGLNVAALETSSDIGPQTKFTDASGKTFASPDDAGMKAAVKLLSPDTNAGAWTVDYGELDSQTSAYPGLMPIYADVPTSGLSSADAARVAQLLDFAAGSGQTPGTANGQLPPGALPMTAGSGLGDEAAYARCVAIQVKAQTGVVPPLTGACPAVPKKAKPAKKHKVSPTRTPTTSPSAAAATVAPPPVSAPPVPTASVSAAAPPTTTTAEPVRTVGAYSALGRFGLPAALVAGLLLLVLGLALRWGAESWTLAKVVGPRAGPWMAATWRRVAAGGRRRR